MHRLFLSSTIQEFVFDSEQVSEELQLSYTADNIRGIFGLYYFNEELYHENNVGAVKLGGVFTSPSADASFKDDHYFSEFNNDLLAQDSYTIFDARVKYVSGSGEWISELWVKNITDELVESGNYALASGRVTTRTFLPPRTIGVTLKREF